MAFGTFVAGLGFAELLQKFLLRPRKFGGRFDDDFDDQIATPAALQNRHAGPADAQLLSALDTGRDVERVVLTAEIGDLLFAVVNLARKAGVHPALALDRANRKFADRFAGIEKLAAERGINVADAGLTVLDSLWDEVKRSEKLPEHD